jgi:glycopeptide antibiotics resistance protein
MDNPFGELPVLPFVVPLAVVVFAVLLWRLHIRRALSLPRAAVAAAIGVYIAGIVGNTIFPIFLTPVPSTEPWTPSLALIPFYDYEIEDAIQNMVVFVPIGILAPLLLTRTSWWRVLSLAAGVSFAVEGLQVAAQRLFGGGHIADINDFLFNVAGGMLGYGLFVIVAHIPRAAKFIDQFRWTPPTQPAAAPAPAHVTDDGFSRSP